MDEKYDAWLNLGYFFASQLREKTLKSKNSSKKLFDFFPKNLSFGKKKYFLRKTPLQDELYGNFGKKLWKKKFQRRFLLYHAIGIYNVEEALMSS